jgi:hypothetical protein
VNAALPARAAVPSFASFVVPTPASAPSGNKDDDMNTDDQSNKGAKGKGRRK